MKKKESTDEEDIKGAMELFVLRKKEGVNRTGLPWWNKGRKKKNSPQGRGS